MDQSATVYRPSSNIIAIEYFIKDIRKDLFISFKLTFIYNNYYLDSSLFSTYFYPYINRLNDILCSILFFPLFMLKWRDKEINYSRWTISDGTHVYIYLNECFCECKTTIIFVYLTNTACHTFSSSFSLPHLNPLYYSIVS